MLATKDNIATFPLIEWLRTYWLYIVIYAFFLYVSSTSVRAGDDWEISQWYRNGFVSSLAGMIRATTFLNGRVASLFFGAFFAHYDVLWRFTAPAVFTSIIYLSAKLFGYVRNPFPVGLSLLMLLSVSNGMRIETYVWLIGNVGYITVIALILLYFNIIHSENTDQRLRFWQHEKLNYLIVALLAFVIGLWVENVTIAFTATNIFLAILSFRTTKRVSPYIRYGIAGSISSCFVLFGSLLYIGRSEGLAVGVKQRILENLSGIMKILVIDNLFIYLIFLFIFIALTTSGKLFSTNKLTRIIGGISGSFVTLVILSKLILQFILDKWYLPVSNILLFINNTFFEVTRPFPIVFCLLILLLVLVAVFFSPQKEKLLMIYCVGMVSAGFMIVAPYLGSRIFVLAIYSVVCITAYLASILVINSIDLRKGILLALAVATLLQMDKFYYHGKYAKQVENIRLQLIEDYRAKVASGLTTEDKLLVLPGYRTDAVYAAANPEFNGFYMGPFKNYYHLPADTNLIIDDGFGVKEFTITPVSRFIYRFEIIPLRDVSEYAFEFVVRKKDRIIYKSDLTSDNFDYYEFPGKGIYTISCVLSHASGQKEIYAIEDMKIRRK